MATAWLAGGSGLVGGVLLRHLLQAPFFDRVISAGRRTLPLDHPKLAQAVIDFSDGSALDALPAPDVAFCCLGTTMKRAGSREAFRAVDQGAVLTFAGAAHRRGARAFLHVSALGADPRSRIFYNAIKGETEAALAQVGFASVYALRPSLLDGEREDRRPAERLSLAVGRALGPVLGKYRPTSVEAIAQTMVALAVAPAPGAHVVEPGGLLNLGDATRAGDPGRAT